MDGVNQSGNESSVWYSGGKLNNGTRKALLFVIIFVALHFFSIFFIFPTFFGSSKIGSQSENLIVGFVAALIGTLVVDNLEF